VTDIKCFGITQIKIAYVKKFKADSIQEIPYTIQSRIFCLQVCYKNIDIQIYKTIILSVV